MSMNLNNIVQINEKLEEINKDLENFIDRIVLEDNVPAAFLLEDPIDKIKDKIKVLQKDINLSASY